ncbi:MAG: hypothetical protein F4Z72_10910 [Gemmatimonadales bacterium]|uniref:hypothetical protein n=1 Tax=Candidatus Palauibacter irciniicola TaxID=3056733 RepID=UPI00137FF4FE|nr:hypothetical protein [Candidatus Palauibacter irciniicola]MYC18551.1 hypothetical protein [Gemmatimonadales bacterium]
MRRSWIRIGALAVLAACGGSNGTGPDDPGVATPDRSEFAVLNSISGTLQQFNRIDGRIVPFGRDIQLEAGFRGRTADFIQDLWVTAWDAPEGSKVVFGSFSTDERTTAVFPNNAIVDPGKPTVIFDAGGTVGALIPARAQDAVYVAFPGTPMAQIAVEAVGTFVERVIPAGQFLVSADGNLDDEDGGREPLGPPRIVLHEFISGSYFDELRLPEGTVGVNEAIVLEDQMLLLAGGAVDPVTSAAVGEGNLVEIDMSARTVQDVNPLGGSGISMEAGRDGLVYVVRTKGIGATETDVLRFSFAVRDWMNGPENPIQPRDRDGSNLNCRVAAGFLDGQILCATYVAAGQGRLVLLSAEGEFIDEAPIGAGTTDILLRPS